MSRGLQPPGVRTSTLLPDGTSAPTRRLGCVIRVGTSGWSYPSWRPGFYPADVQPSEFLRYYAERFDTVELNATGYRLPSEDQFKRWAETVPDGFRFAVKLPPRAYLDRVTPFLERVAALRRPPRPDPRRRRGGARRGPRHLRHRLGAARHRAGVGLQARDLGGRRRWRRPCRRSRRRAVPIPAPPRAAVHRRRAAGVRRAYVPRLYVFLRHEDGADRGWPPRGAAQAVPHQSKRLRRRLLQRLHRGFRIDQNRRREQHGHPDHALPEQAPPRPGSRNGRPRSRASRTNDEMVEAAPRERHEHQPDLHQQHLPVTLSPQVAQVRQPDDAQVDPGGERRQPR